MIESNKILCGDALTVLKSLPSDSINCCITSPPYYGLRDYGMDGQIGLEQTPGTYVARLTEVFMRCSAFSRRMEPYGSISETAMQAAARGQAIGTKKPSGQQASLSLLFG